MIHMNEIEFEFLSNTELKDSERFVEFDEEER